MLDKRTGRLVAHDDEKIGTAGVPRPMVVALAGQGRRQDAGLLRRRRRRLLRLRGPATSAREARAAEEGLVLRLQPAGVPRSATASRSTTGTATAASTAATTTTACYVGPSEIIATPVFHNNRVYVAVGQDPLHGRGRGMLNCIDATQTGDISRSGRVWSYDKLDRSLSTVSIADGLVYVADRPGRIHCLDAETGKCYWVHDTRGGDLGLDAGGRRQALRRHAEGVLRAGGRQDSQAVGPDQPRELPSGPRPRSPPTRCLSPPSGIFGPSKPRPRPVCLRRSSVKCSVLKL